MVSEFRAFLSRDRQTVLMTTGRWSLRVASAEATAWRDFYRKLWGRGAKKPGEPGPYAKHYEHTCQVLDAIIQEIKGAP